MIFNVFYYDIFNGLGANQIGNQMLNDYGFAGT